MEVSQNIEKTRQLSNDLEAPLLYKHSQEMKSIYWRHRCAPMFTILLSITIKTWN